MFKEGHFLTVLQENGGFPLVVASCDEVSLTMPLPNCWSNPLPWLHVDGLRDLMLCILLDNRNGTLLLVFGILPPYTTQTKHTQQINQLLQLQPLTSIRSVCQIFNDASAPWQLQPFSFKTSKLSLLFYRTTTDSSTDYFISHHQKSGLADSHPKLKTPHSRIYFFGYNSRTSLSYKKQEKIWSTKWSTKFIMIFWYLQILLTFFLMID